MTLQSVTQKLSAWRRYRQAVRELHMLSDRELADLGITRYEIENIAKKSAGV